MHIQSIDDLKNTLLIALPSLVDTELSQSLTLICEHHKSTLGIMINRPLDMQLGALFDQMNIVCDDIYLKNMPVFKGGPVQVERGFVLHTKYASSNFAQQVAQGLYLSTSKQILMDIAQGHGPQHFLVALGYVGWDEHQLVHEIRRNFWLNGLVSHDIIFDVPVQDRWEEAARRVGLDIKHICCAVGHA